MEQINPIKNPFVVRIYKACPSPNQACIDFRTNRAFFDKNSYYFPDDSVLVFLKKNRAQRKYVRRTTIIKQNQVLTQMIDVWASKTK